MLQSFGSPLVSPLLHKVLWWFCCKWWGRLVHRYARANVVRISCCCLGAARTLPACWEGASAYEWLPHLCQCDLARAELLSLGFCSMARLALLSCDWRRMFKTALSLYISALQGRNWLRLSPLLKTALWWLHLVFRITSKGKHKRLFSSLNCCFLLPLSSWTLLTGVAEREN